MLVAPPFVGTDQPLHGSYDTLAIAPSDSADVLAIPSMRCVGLYVAVSGNVAATTPGGVSVSFESVPSGTTLDVALKRVLATGTTASGLQALYRPRSR